ncbi:putative transcriptional regulator, TetR family [Treponema primitia ZAS-2]|uniref:Putative transcriptional regulator, TetR family n=1 Tax=Treponema primitia (strain ATCC BAA-887 / DSM 12427 / ZAS-2) TaxID=545694 RepID=F5YMV4_TREPZ|nr:TetR/AcrR family transcriptional regulator [Treponema primitia]AEF83899.1 putative transcriptional regulator, TetR family [Treponema primitia ZAS-2]
MDIERNNETKQMLISTALKLFKISGYEKVTINQICTEVGIAKNTFYYYFNSKEDLLEASVGAVQNMTVTNLTEILLSGDAYFEQFWQIQKPIYDFVTESGIGISQQFLILRPEKRQELLHVLDEFYAVMGTVLQKAQETGEIRNSSSPQELIAVTRLLFVGIISLWTSFKGGFEFTDAMRAALEASLDLRTDMRKTSQESIIKLPF